MIAVSCMSVITIILFSDATNVYLSLHKDRNEQQPPPPSRLSSSKQSQRSKNHRKHSYDRTAEHTNRKKSDNENNFICAWYVRVKWTYFFRRLNWILRSKVSVWLFFFSPMIFFSCSHHSFSCSHFSAEVEMLSTLNYLIYFCTLSMVVCALNYLI